jgi:ribose-phosphate pyrophosphokinase
MHNSPLLLSTSQYDTFAKEIARIIGGEVGEIERRRFPDGEWYQRLLTEVHERSVVLIGGTTDDTHTLFLYDLACAAVKYGARRLDVCVPYFGYSTMERAVYPGEVVTAKTRARLLSAVPYAARGNHFHLLDLHSEGIPHYFEGPITTQHLSTTALWVERLSHINQGDFVLASTDAGRAKHVERLANLLGVDAALIIKRRTSGRETEIVGVNARVEGRVVVIYDDMVRTGGSLIKAARAYKAAGAQEIYAVCSHGVFPEEAWQTLCDTKLFTQIIATDSHPQAKKLSAHGLEVLSTSSIFAQALQKIFNT